MAGLGPGEASVSILQRLLANAALRDEAGRLRGPKPGTGTPWSGGLLGWSQKDLQSEFGIAADLHPSSPRPPGWPHVASQDCGHGAASPRGALGPGHRDWARECGSGAGEGGGREWADISSSKAPRDTCAPEQLMAHSGWAVRQPAPLGTLGWEAAAQDPEPGRRDSGDRFSSLQAELQDQEFGKRDSRDMLSSRVVELQEQELGKRDSWDTFPSLHADFQGQEFGKRDSLGPHSSQEPSLQDWEFAAGGCLGSSARQPEEEPARESGSEAPCSYSSQDAEAQDREFEKRDSLLGVLSRPAEVPRAQVLRQSPWMQDHGDGPREQDSTSDVGAPSSGLSPQVAQRPQGEFEKPLCGQDGGAKGPPEELQGWQGSGTSWEVAGALGPGEGGLGGGDTGQRGWAAELSLGVAPQPEDALSPGPRDWGEDLVPDPALRSTQFGIIGDDRASGAGPSPPSTAGGGRFVSPGEMVSRPGDWADQLGLRNLDVSHCGAPGDLAKAREVAIGQVGWLDGGLEVQGSGATGAREEDWTVEVGVPSIHLAGDGAAGSLGQARDSGMGQADWSGLEAGEFLRCRERGVGQAAWSPDLVLGGVVSRDPRELGVRPGSWGDDLGLRNLEVPCDLDSGGARGCGVGRDRGRGLSGPPSGAREHGAGEAGPSLERDFRSSRCSSPRLEARESRESGVREPQGADGCGSSPEAPSEDAGPETAGATALAASPGQRPACTPPPGTQGLPEGTLLTSSGKAEAASESLASGLSILLEQEGASAGSHPEEPEERGGDPLPARRPQPDGGASCGEEVDGTWGLEGPGCREQDPTLAPRRPPPGPPARGPSQDFSFIEDTEVLDSAVYRSRAHLGRKRGHRAPAIRPGGTLGLAEASDSDARLFRDSTEPRASRVPSSDEEVAEEPQSRRTRMSLGTKGLKVNLFPGLSPSALKAKLRSRNRSAEEAEPAEGKAGQKEAVVQRSKSCKVPGLGKPLALPPKPEKSSGSEGSSPHWLQALKLKKKKV